MQRHLLVGILSACVFSSIALSGNAFADKPSDASTKSISIKNLASRQNKVAEDLSMLDAKLSTKANSNTGASYDKNVTDQSNLVKKALGEAKQAADDLAQADKLNKSTGKKATADSNLSTNLLSPTNGSAKK